MLNEQDAHGLKTYAWKTGTCEVCGKPFDYLTRRRPHTCNDGECKYRFHYKIEPKSWATYQPTLFDE